MAVGWTDWSDAIAKGVRSVPDVILAHAADVLKRSSIVLTAGNGGSHALASHAAQALMKPGYAAGGGTAAVCLSDGVPTLTAHANDEGWESALVNVAEPFFRHMEKDTDSYTAGTGTLWLFSSSGKSKNIVALARTGLAARFRVVAFTGFEGEPLKSLATVSIHVASNDYEVVEPVHCALLHRAQYHLRAIT